MSRKKLLINKPTFTLFLCSVILRIKYKLIDFCPENSGSLLLLLHDVFNTESTRVHGTRVITILRAQGYMVY